MSKKEKQHSLHETEKRQQDLSSAKAAETVEVNWSYFLKTVSTLLFIAQVLMMHKRQLVTTENAIQQIDTLMNGWVKMP